MAIDKVVKTDSSTYTVTKGDTTYTVKVKEGDKLTKKYAGALPFTESEWAAIEASQNQQNTSSSPVSSKVSVFSSPSMYQPSINAWSYNPCHFGNTISFPETPMSAANDKAVWQFEDSVNNMPMILGGTINTLNAMLQKMESEQAEMLKKLLENISSNTKISHDGDDSDGADKADKNDNDKSKNSSISTSEELEKLQRENEKLKRELEEANRVKSYRETLKDNTVFDRKVNDIVERLYKGMKGANYSSVMGEIGNDKKTSDAVHEISSKNVVEVMDKYKETVCFNNDGGYMGNDFNLIESIYEDFSGDKYSSKINHLKDALTQRARALIAQYGDKAGITEDDIAEFESNVKNNMNDTFWHKWGWGGDCEKLKWAFENFKEKVKSAEGNEYELVYTTETVVPENGKTETVAETKTTTASSQTTQTSSVQTESESEEAKKTVKK